MKLIDTSFEVLKNHVGILRLNRPSRMNALSFDMGESLLQLESLVKKHELRSLVLTGQGEKAFSTGRDLKDSKSHTKEEAFRYMCLARDTVVAIRKLSIPTIAALNGYSFGWGMELALGCDLRVAYDKSIMCFPECGLGIFPGAAGTVLLPRLIGPSKAKYLILTSKRFDGKEAFNMGIVNETSSSVDGCIEHSIKLATEIAVNGPLGVKGARKVIDEGLDLCFEKHIELSNEERFPLNDSKDFRVALEHFEKGIKGRPKFEGK